MTWHHPREYIPDRPVKPGISNTFSCYLCKRFKTMIGRKPIPGTHPKIKFKCRDCIAEGK